MFTEDYIITLEQKKSWKSMSRYIRIYLNWHLELPQKSVKQRTKVRIAGKAHTLHSSKEYVPQLEVVDLPLDGTVTALDVCRVTGNFAIAFGREVSTAPPPPKKKKKMMIAASTITMKKEEKASNCW